MIRTVNNVKHFNWFMEKRIKFRLSPSGIKEIITLGVACQPYHHLYRKETRKPILCIPAIYLAIENKILTARSFSSANNTYRKELVVKHDSQKKIFYLDVDSVGVAYIEYDRNVDLIILKHTFVPKELGGRGIGKILAKEALEYAATNNLQIEIQCPFIREYVLKYDPKYIKYIKK